MKAGFLQNWNKNKEKIDNIRAIICSLHTELEYYELGNIHFIKASKRISAHVKTLKTEPELIIAGQKIGEIFAE